jgi:phosphatidate phosphatase PAH1
LANEYLAYRLASTCLHGLAVDCYGEGMNCRTITVIVLISVATLCPLVAAAQPAKCTTASAFLAPGKKTKWKRKRTGLWVTPQGAPDHRGYDVVVPENDPQVLVGKFTYGPLHKDLEREEVDLFIQSKPPCGHWISYGTKLTSKDGQFGTLYGVEDDGGHAFFALSKEQSLGQGHHQAMMLVKGDHSSAPLHLFVVAQGTRAVVFDIDATLTRSDGEVLRQTVATWSDDYYDPEPRAGAADVVRLWWSKGHQIIYVTGRPDFLCGMSRRWLDDRGFAPGALFCTSKNSQVLPNNDGVGKFKSEKLAELQSLGLVFVAGYGNAPTDVFAYENAGIPKERTYIIGPHRGVGGTVGLTSYVDHLPGLKKILAPPVTSDTSGSR